MGKSQKHSSYRLGIKAEYWAAFFLICKGYQINGLRTKTPLGEIDIVARKRKLLVCVEVKARRDLNQLGEAVTPSQQYRITQAAEIIVARYPEHDIRFDVIFIVPWRFPRHLKAAWHA